MTTGDRPIPQPTVIVLNRDLMLGIVIGNTAKTLGYAVERVTKTPELVERLRNGRSEVSLAIIDMNMTIDWDQITGWIRSGQDLPPILGFGPHVDIEGRRSAKQAGLTRIVSNGEFHRDMARLIRRYARPSPANETAAVLD
ncbi:hypothetical protein BH24CHL4_BH24CHL4_23090 [soil metagenome]